jgi:predicted permease
MEDIIAQILPILFLLALGYWVRRRRFLAESTIEDLKKIIVSFALPAVLFTSFLTLELKAAYLVVFVMIFLLCVALFVLGRALQTALGIKWTYFPFLMTGFEYGMLGVSLYGTIYGMENIGYIAVFDLGHEIFIWFVFLALLLREQEGGDQSPLQLAQSFVQSPVIVGIVSGLLFNLLGAQSSLQRFAVTRAVLSTFDFLGHLTIPLILIIVGYGIQLNRSGLKDALPVVLLRLGLLIPLALVLNAVVTRGMLGLGKPSEAALFTLLVLPPPFIIPLYTPDDLPAAQSEYINNTLTLHTLGSVVAYVAYFAFIA